MKGVRIHGPGEFRIDDVEEPQAGPDDAIVRVHACGICGSDLGYVKLGGVAGPTGHPMPIGHELSGVVEEVGANVQGVAPGARVVVNPMGAGNQIGNGGGEGGFAPRLLVRNASQGESLIPIPDALSFETAALAEPLGVGSKSVDQSGAGPGDKVVVFGAGPIGLTATATLAHRGVEDVVVVDLSPARLEIARKLGARATLDASKDDVWQEIRALHGTSPVLGAPMAATDAYIEASGAAPVISQVLGNAKSDATLSVVGLHRAEVPVNFLLVMMKQLHIVGSMAYPEDWRPLIDMLQQIDLAPMVTHRFPLERFDDAFAVAQDPSAGAKVMIEVAER